MTKHSQVVEDGKELLLVGVVETVRQPLLVLDGERRIRMVNLAFCQEFDVTASAIELTSVYDFAGARWETPDLRRALEEHLAHGDRLEGFYVETNPGGPDERLLVLNASRFRPGDEELILIAIEDVTARVREQAKLEQLVAERTADLEAFSYSVSHDLRAPLRALDGYSRALQEDYGDMLPPEGQRFIRTIRDNAEAMSALIDGLLAFARLGNSAISVRPVDMRELVGSALAELTAAEENRNVEVVLGDLPVHRADPLLARQVWVNLLANALKYTRGEEQPRVEAGSRLVDGERVWFVRDNGVGFDMQYAGKLFDVFQRLHRSEDFDGIGIGLAMVRRIVERCGGRVWADAAEGVGAEFMFTLAGAGA